MGNYRNLNISKKSNKITKISQEDTILFLKSLSIKLCGAKKRFSEFPDQGWKFGSIDR